MASSKLIVSVSGVRGIIGDSFTPEALQPYLRAFASMVPGSKIVMGSDSRPSAAWLRPLAHAALVAAGKQVIDLGLAPTPTVGFMVRKKRADAGLVLTASHNPIEYNGLKFFNKRGEFFTVEENKQLLTVLKKKAFVSQPVAKIGSVSTPEDPLADHLAALLKFFRPLLQRESVRKKKLKVVVDCCNGAASEIAPRLLAELGCQVVPLFDEPTKAFPRGAEPLPHNLRVLGKTVKAKKADLGFAIDPDADRLAVVDQTGTPLGEERTLVIAADAFFDSARGKARRGPYVVNLSTSMANDDVAKKHGVEILRTKIGEAHVVDRINQTSAPFGGEGNGGVIFPRIHPGRDAATAMAWMVLALSRTKQTISELNSTIPMYEVARDKLALADVTVKQALAAAKSAFKNANSVDRTDGLKFVWDDCWFHIRPSNTEPIVRLTAEAPTKKKASQLIAQARKAIAG
jgi:phosphomannomutase